MDTSPAEVNRLRAETNQSSGGPDTQTLLSDEQLNRLRQIIETVKLDWKTTVTLAPAAVGNELAAAQLKVLGLDDDDSAELVILNRARGLSLRSFADWSQQLQYMSGLSPEAQVDWLMYDVETFDPEQFDRIFQAWFWGDVSRLEAELITDFKQALPDVYQALITDRNNEWATEMVRVLDEEPGTFFVAVGVGHLVGPDSVQSMLEDQGHRAIRLH